MPCSCFCSYGGESGGRTAFACEEAGTGIPETEGKREIRLHQRCPSRLEPRQASGAYQR